MTSFRYVFGSLCALILIDGIGLGLIFPILTPVFLDPHLAIVDLATSVSARNFYYGLTLAVFPLGQFFSAPILGDFSDGLGRRKILIFAAYAVGACYALSGLAIVFKSLWLLVLSRFLSGCVSGSQPIAQAAIMDMSAPDQKAKNLGFMFFFTSIGFTFGPLLGGWLSDATTVSWFNLATPMYFAALASIVCGFMIQCHFKETLTARRSVSFRPLYGVTLIARALAMPAVRALLTVSFLLQLGWSCFFQMMPMYLTQVYAFTGLQIAHYITVISIGFAVAFCGAIGYLVKRFQELPLLKWVSVIICVLFALAACLPNTRLLWCVGAPIGFCVANIYVLSTTLASNKVPASYQGWLMGANMGLASLAWLASPLIGSVLINWRPVAPLVFACVMAVISMAVLWFRGQRTEDR